MNEAKIKEKVKKNYAKIAKKESSCCPFSCCQEESHERMGYSEKELESLPEGTFSLGCGNPVALASLKEGEIVLDLGSGSGFDCFLASKKVGKKGKVIGVDMVPEMVERARDNAKKGNYKNVEFRLGEIENLPVADNSIDVVISNCVINLSPNKKRVFEEAFRVLKPGGRLMISDIVLLKELPKKVEKNEKAYVSCVSGAIMKDKYLELIKKAGFQDVKVFEETLADSSSIEALMEEIGISLEKHEEHAVSFASINVYAVKPNNG